MEKKITRKVISKATDVNKKPEIVEQAEEPKKDREKKVCYFCQSKTNPNYTDTAALRRFTTDRAKIVPKLRTNVCSKHQRGVTKHIKYARHLSLLPFTPKV